MTVIKPRTPGGRYTVRVEDPATKIRHNRGPRDGYIFETEDEALIGEMELKLAIAKGELREIVDIDEPTVDHWADHWLEHYHGPNTSRPGRTTKPYNEQEIKGFRKLYGKKKLGEITREMATLYARAHRNQSKSIAAMFADAVDAEKLLRNPFSKLKLGAPPSRGRKDIEALTHDEVNSIADLAGRQDGDHGLVYFCYVIVAAWTGLRTGEMCALQFKNIDFENRRLTVCRDEGNMAPDFVLGPPKTRASVRDFLLYPAAFEALRTMRDREAQVSRRGITAIDPDAFVFRTLRGKPMRSQSITYWFRPIATAWTAGLPEDHWMHARMAAGGKGLEPYEFRHHFGSQRAENGMQTRHIAKLMGNTPAVCEGYYIHLSKQGLDDQIRAETGENVRSIRPTEGEAQTG